jgi:hypothetical protein
MKTWSQKLCLLLSIQLVLVFIYFTPHIHHIASSTLLYPQTRYNTRYTNILDRYSTIYTSNPYTAQTNTRVLILQHAPNPSPLAKASIALHRMYAAVYGYDYHLDENEYVWSEIKGVERSNNKLYVMCYALEREIGKGGQGAEWIL